MEENEIITQFIENPEDEYSLQMISTLFKSQNLDYLTYQLVCNGVVDKLLDLIQTSPNRLYEEIVARVWNRYRNERFPSLGGLTQNLQENMFETCIKLASKNEYSRLENVLEPFFNFMLNNEDSYN